MRPICVKCRREMTCAKNDYLVVSPAGGEVNYGDRWMCPSCGADIVTGFGKTIDARAVWVSSAAYAKYEKIIEESLAAGEGLRLAATKE